MSEKNKTKLSEGTTLSIKFWGVRGSIPTPGRDTSYFGGNTSCVSVEDSNTLIILDGGSGLRVLGQSLMPRIFTPAGKKNLDMNIFFSHTHWDHIQGIPFFAPMYIAGNTVHMFGEKKARVSLEGTLHGQQQYPNFPITIEEISINGANVGFTELVAGTCVHIKDIEINNTKLSHPDGVFCYKISEGKKSVVYATDTEHRDVLDPRLLKIAADADVLIYDAQYTPEEYLGNPPPAKFDWGHSTYEWGVRTCFKILENRSQSPKPLTLVLFHHDPGHTDIKIREIEKAAQNMAKDKIEIIAAYEGLEINL